MLATVLGAVDRGFRVIVAMDAICSSADGTHAASVRVYDSRFGEQVEAVTTDVILSHWTADGPRHRAASACASGGDRWGRKMGETGAEEGALCLI